MELLDTPDKDGFYGSFGGAFVPECLKTEFEKITAAFLKYKDDAEFNAELNDLYAHYVGRPSPVYFAKNLSRKHGTDIYLKREDLNHTGAHKINHCLGEALLAKRMGKKKIIAETGAGQHGVALATAAALTGLECDIYMGAVDVAKEKPNVDRMQLLGAKVISVAGGTRTLKDAVDAAFEVYVKTYPDVLYAIGSVVGPHPFPMMVEYFQSIVGKEARVQFKELTGNLPECVVACVGGGSKAFLTVFCTSRRLRCSASNRSERERHSVLTLPVLHTAKKGFCTVLKILCCRTNTERLPTPTRLPADWIIPASVPNIVI